MYALLFSKICVSFAHSALANRQDAFSALLTAKAFYIVILYVIMLPNIVKKNIKELKFTSVLLFFVVISMLSIFIGKSVMQS